MICDLFCVPPDGDDSEVCEPACAITSSGEVGIAAAEYNLASAALGVVTAFFRLVIEWVLVVFAASSTEIGLKNKDLLEDLARYDGNVTPVTFVSYSSTS